jgi:hypothetical protein
MVVALVVLAAACDWTTVGFNANRSGWNAPDTAITPANVGTLTQRWKATLGSTSASDPVVAGGKVFASSNAVGGVAGALRSFDAKGVAGCTGAAPATCAPLWSVDYPPEPILPNTTTTVSAPTVTGGKVAVGVQTLNRFGGTGIGVYDANTGTSAFSAAGGGYPSLVATTGRIYSSVTAIGQRNPAFISVTYLGVVDATTGAVQFVATNEYGSAFGDPAIASGRLFAVTGNSLQVFDAAGSTGCSPYHPPAWPDGVVNAPKYCYPLWSATLPNVAYSRPTVANGFVYVGDSAGTVSAVPANGCGASTCNPTWTGQAGTAAFGTVAVTGTSVFVGSTDGKLYAFPAKGCGAATCAPTWTAPGAAGAPSIAGDVLFSASNDGHLRAFDANGCGKATCTPLWDTNVGTPLRGAPAISDGRVFVTDTAGTLHAYGLP